MTAGVVKSADRKLKINTKRGHTCSCQQTCINAISPYCHFKRPKPNRWPADLLHLSVGPPLVCLSSLLASGENESLPSYWGYIASLCVVQWGTVSRGGRLENRTTDQLSFLQLFPFPLQFTQVWGALLPHWLTSNPPLAPRIDGSVGSVTDLSHKRRPVRLQKQWAAAPSSEQAESFLRQSMKALVKL